MTDNFFVHHTGERLNDLLDEDNKFLRTLLYPPASQATRLIEIDRTHENGDPDKEVQYSIHVVEVLESEDEVDRLASDYLMNYQEDPDVKSMLDAYHEGCAIVYTFIVCVIKMSDAGDLEEVICAHPLTNMWVNLLDSSTWDEREEEISEVAEVFARTIFR